MDQDYIRRSAVDFKIRQCEATKKNKARKSRRKS